MRTTALLTTVFMLLEFVTASIGQSITEVKIGSQDWMTSNLDVSTFRNGDAIAEVKTDKEWDEAGKQGKPAWCCYSNERGNGKKYGKLYNWYAVNDSRTIAPEGWHVPSAAEWQMLIDSSDGGDIAGGKLKETGTAHWQSPNTGATNENGFSALPGGYRDNMGHFFTLGHYAAFWTASECGRLSALGRHLSRGDIKVYLNCISKSYGFSLRCVRD